MRAMYHCQMYKMEVKYIYTVLRIFENIYFALRVFFWATTVFICICICTAQYAAVHVEKINYANKARGI